MDIPWPVWRPRRRHGCDWSGGGVVHGGTYTANLVALSAARATVRILAETDALATVNRVGRSIREVLGRVFTAAGINIDLLGRFHVWGPLRLECQPTIGTGKPQIAIYTLLLPGISLLVV